MHSGKKKTPNKKQSAEMQHCSTFNQSLHAQLHLYTREDLEQSRKGNESDSTGIFHPDFCEAGGRGVQVLQVSVKF